MGSPVSRWDGARWGPISLEAVAGRHRPEGRHRIRLAWYAPGVGFPGSSRACRLYVLRGACTVVAGGRLLELGPGDVADLPTGACWFQVAVTAPWEVVSVRGSDEPTQARTGPDLP